MFPWSSKMRKDNLLLLWINLNVCLCDSRMVSKYQRFGWSSSKESSHNGWLGSMAVPQHKLIPSLRKQWKGIVGFADSRNEILLQVCYAIKATQHQPTATWVKAVAFAGNYWLWNYLLLLVSNPGVWRYGNAVSFAIHVLGGIGEAKSIRS